MQVRRDMGNSSIPLTSRDLPIRPTRARQRVRDHGMGNWGWYDYAGEPHHAREHQESQLLPPRRAELALDSRGVPLLP